MTSEQRPVCARCVHYKVTWDPSHPHGCTAMRFKSKEIPSQKVLEDSGVQCQSFTPKPGKTPGASRRLA